MFKSYFMGFTVLLAGFSLTFLAGFSLGSSSAAMMYQPSDSEFLRTTTSEYFQALSRDGLVKYANYSDCEVVEEDDGTGNNRMQKFGICGFTDPETGKSFYFSVALTPLATVDYRDVEGDFQ